MKKLGIVFFTLLLIIGLGVNSYAYDNNENVEEVEITNRSGNVRGVGQTIAETFPDPAFAKAIANEVSRGNVNAILTQKMVDTFEYLTILDAAIMDFTGLEVLSNMKNIALFNYTGSTLQDNICSLSQLRGISIDSTQLTGLPACVYNMTTLTSLLINNNPVFANLPESLGNLTNINSILIGYNPLMTVLPDGLCNLTKMNALQIYNVPVSKLPDNFGNFSELTYLNINTTDITALPESFGNLTSLTSFSIYRTKLASLPESIGNLTGLSSIMLSDNELASLPESIGNLTNLTGLYLNNNQLTSLPASIVNLKDTQITLVGNLLPSTYHNHLNTLGFRVNYVNETQASIHLKPGIAPVTVASGNDLLTFDFAGSLKFIDGTQAEVSPITNLAYGISVGHKFVFDNYVDEAGNPVDINTYIVNGVVQSNVTLFASVRAAGTGVFPNTSDNAVTTEKVQLNLVATSFLLTYDANGGTGTVPSPQALTQGQTGVVVNPLTKTGFTFTGWNTMIDGTGTNWISGTTVMPANDVVVYAQWEPVVATTLPTTGSISYTFGLSSLIIALIVYRIKKSK